MGFAYGFIELIFPIARFGFPSGPRFRGRDTGVTRPVLYPWIR